MGTQQVDCCRDAETAGAELLLLLGLLDCCCFGLFAASAAQLVQVPVLLMLLGCCSGAGV